MTARELSTSTSQAPPTGGVTAPAGGPPAAARLLRPGLLLALGAILAVLPLLDVGTAGVLPGTLASPGSLQLLALCLVFGALALSYDLLLGFTGLLSFGHALYFAAGVYTLNIALSDWHLGLLPALGITAAVALVLPLAVGAVSLRTTGITFAMVTLAFAQAGSVIVTQDPGGLTGGELGQTLATEHVPDFLVGVLNTRNLYWLALALLIIVYAVSAYAVRSAPGRVWQAIRENERRVRILGLRPYGFKLAAFCFASFLAAACGVVYLLLLGGAHPNVTTPEFTLSLLVMVVLGGSGLRWGAVLGGVLYTYLDQRLGALASSGAIGSLPAPLRIPLSQPLFILGVIFILIVLFLPGGIGGALSRGWHAATAPQSARTVLRRALRFRHSAGSDDG
jgi:branched-chain amino acid transport system permease protein